MAKTLDERITAALSKDARAATVADLQRELTGLIDATTIERDDKAAIAISPTIDEVTADLAADEVPKLDRKIARLGGKAALLATRHEELMDSERRRDGLARYAEVEKRRDQLVADLKEHWPRLTREMIALLERIAASDAECKQTGSMYGKPALVSAEMIARGTNTFHGDLPISRLDRNNIEALDASTNMLRGRPAWTGRW